MSVRYQEMENQVSTINRPGRVHGWIEAEDDARIYVRVQGEGIPILAMGGLGSGALTSAKVAKLFADRYMLITYDRRGTFRSASDNKSWKFDMAQQCRDVQRILAAYGLSSVMVLATCSATSIALELLVNYPELVNAMVIHDPMSVAVLPDAEAAANNFLKYERITLESSADDAMTVFLTDFDLPYPDEFRRVVEREWGRVLQELEPCALYQPNIERLRLHRDQLVTATGQHSLDRGFSFARSAKALSEQVGCRFAVVPGNHTGYFQDPDIFAEAILSLVDS